MNQFLLILLFTLARTFGVQNLPKQTNPKIDVDVSDYILPDEFFPENDRDAIPVFQHIPDIDVSQYVLPDEFYPENDRDALPTRRFLHRRPPLKPTGQARPQTRTGEPLHSTKLTRFRGVKNEWPIYEWNMRMRNKNARTMNPFVDGGITFDYCCPFQQFFR